MIENMVKYKIQLLIDRFIKILSACPGVECVSLNEAVLTDPLHPYFALIFDVFYTGSAPTIEERRCLLGEDAIAFESQPNKDKDRFLIKEFPVRLEYKSTEKIDELVSIADTKYDSLWLIKNSGTYGFYRLVNGEILFERSNWIAAVRQRLAGLDQSFWNQMRVASQSKMEHLLNDLGAALFEQDDFHYLISEALFIKTVCFTLFCINRRFEPSHRAYYKQVLELPIQPDGFHAQIDSFLRSDAEMTMARKYTLAQLIVRSISKLSLCSP
jgi:hypothetical protein